MFIMFLNKYKIKWETNITKNLLYARHHADVFPQTVSHCYSQSPSVTDPAFGCMSPMGKLRLHEVKQVAQRAAVPPEFTVCLTLPSTVAC